MTRVDQGDERAGATVTSSATPISPSSRVSTLSRKASMRIEPQPSPTTAIARAAEPRRADPSSRQAAATAPRAAMATTASGIDTQTASATAHAAEATSSAGQLRSTAILTA